MKDELSIDNILDSNEIENLFEEPSNNDVKESSASDKEDKEDDKEPDNTGDKDKDKTTEVIDVDNLFTDKPESVGSEKEDIEGKEDTSPDKGDSTSPKNFYSSIAKALKEEGIFPDLNEEEYLKINKPSEFRELVDKQIQAGLTEKQKRIDNALNAGVESDDIKKYESTISYLDSIGDDKISDEVNGENLRKQLIFQDFINRGYSKDRASREVTKSLNAGTDIDDAREALSSNKEFFNTQYQSIIDKAKEIEDEEISDRDKQAEALKRSILEDNKVFGDVEVDKPTRAKVFDNISKPIYKDPETGQLYTAIQKYEMDNRIDFIKNIGLVYTLTDGFKNIDKLVNGKVKKEVRKGLQELESTLNNTSRDSDGNLKFVSGVGDDSESIINKGWTLDV